LSYLGPYKVTTLATDGLNGNQKYISRQMFVRYISIHVILEYQD